MKLVLVTFPVPTPARQGTTLPQGYRCTLLSNLDKKLAFNEAWNSENWMGKHETMGIATHKWQVDNEGRMHIFSVPNVREFLNPTKNSQVEWKADGPFVPPEKNGKKDKK